MKFTANLLTLVAVLAAAMNVSASPVAGRWLVYQLYEAHKVHRAHNDDRHPHGQGQ